MNEAHDIASEIRERGSHIKVEERTDRMTGQRARTGLATQISNLMVYTLQEPGPDFETDGEETESEASS